jgi:hypothetical protein
LFHPILKVLQYDPVRPVQDRMVWFQNPNCSILLRDLLRPPWQFCREWCMAVGIELLRVVKDDQIAALLCVLEKSVSAAVKLWPDCIPTRADDNCVKLIELPGFKVRTLE